MTPHLASAAVDIALWAAIVALVAPAICSRLAAFTRRRSVKVTTRRAVPQRAESTTVPQQRTDRWV